MRPRQHNYCVLKRATRIFSIIIFLTAFLRLPRSADGQIVHFASTAAPQFDADDTVHEQLGQLHFPAVQYEEYVSHVKYTEEPEYTTMGIGPVFEFTHSLLNLIHQRNVTYLLPDYVVHANASVFNLGKKYVENDWAYLISENRILTLLWILPLLFLIFIMPFIAVIYCCFGCWRCKTTCPPCDTRSDIKRLIYSLLLFLLILGLVLCFIITVLSHKQVSRNVVHSIERMQRGSKDTCAFLRDVSLHLHHLLVTNVETLKDQVSDEAHDAHRHILLDLVDTSKGNALTELERILGNIPEAIRVLRDIEEAEQNLRFFGAMYRDCVRGIKRDLTFVFVTLCDLKNCFEFVSKFQLMSTSICLHFDDIPNSTVFYEPLEEAIEKNLIDIPRRGLQRLQVIGETIKYAVDPIIPPILAKIDYVASQLRTEYVLLNDIIDSTISEIHLRTQRAANSFDDINERFGVDRRIYTNIACLSLFLIIITLIFSLICGLCVRKNNTGSYCMLFAMLFIFCVFSFITLVGLFYYMLGMVAYQATCRHLEELEAGESSKLVDDLKSCRKDQNIFSLLTENDYYDADRLMSVDTGRENSESKWHQFSGNLTEFTLITIKEIDRLNQTLYPLYPYKGKLFTQNLCKNLSSPKLADMPSDIRRFLSQVMFAINKCGNQKTKMHAACCTAHIVVRDMIQLRTLEFPIYNFIDIITEKVPRLNALISAENFTFGETMEMLIPTIQRTERFIRDWGSEFINTLGVNLTKSLDEKIVHYRSMTLKEIQEKVGPCKPLAYIQDRGTRYACQHLIDPINGFWLGLLLSTLLFLPILFVGHKLICLYRTDGDHKIVFLARSDGCPTCTGAPIVHHPVVICSGAQQTNCQCQMPQNSYDSADSEIGISKTKRE